MIYCLYTAVLPSFPWFILNGQNWTCFGRQLTWETCCMHWSHFTDDSHPPLLWALTGRHWVQRKEATILPPCNLTKMLAHSYSVLMRILDTLLRVGRIYLVMLPYHHGWPKAAHWQCLFAISSPYTQNPNPARWNGTSNTPWASRLVDNFGINEQVRQTWVPHQPSS